MRTRPLIVSVILMLGLLAAPVAACAQQAEKMFRVGYIGINRAEDVQHLLEALRQGLREHGWVEGQTIAFDYRWAERRPERLPVLAAELVRLKVNVLVVGVNAAIAATKDATRTIPIVMTGSGDPVADGFVTSLARPGGNITGLTFIPGPEIGGKQLELLRQAVPQSTRLAVLSNPTNPSHAAVLKETRGAAQRLGVQVRPWEARYPAEIDGALVAIAKERMSAVLVLSDAMFFGQRGRLAELAAKHRLPAMYGLREHVDAGGLMAYGASLRDNFRRAAIFVDRILKGANPATLPIERPTKFEFVINLKTAKTLGLTISPSLLVRADEVVE